MKNTSLFKLSALSLALFGQSVYAAEVSHTCSVSTDCNYITSIVTINNVSTGESKTERFWSINSNRFGNNNDDLNARLVAQHYQNTPASSYDPQGRTFDLISVSQFDTSRKAHLYIPSGTTAKLDKIGTGTGRLVYLYNADGQIDSGVTLTVGSGQSEEDDSPLMTAIHLGGQGKLNTSADIVVNAINSEGIWVSDKAQLTAKNHKIDLVSGETQGVTTQDNGSAILENVTIKGGQHNQSGLIAKNESSIQFNNSTVDLTNNILTLGLAVGGGSITVGNSKVSAHYAIIADHNGESFDVDNVVNIKNSNVVGRELLVGVNNEDGEKPRSTTINVLDSKVAGRVVNLEDVSSDDGEWDIRLDTKENTNVFLTMKNSQWAVNGDSHLDTLAMANSTTTFESNNAFQTLTISQDLIGNGHFDLNTDLANQQSDKIVVKGEDSGNFTLGIKDSGNEPNAANGKVTLVETQQGQAQFSLKDRDYVDAGAYRYRLNKEGTNWVLSNRDGEKNTPVVDPVVDNVVPSEQTDPTPVTPPVTSTLTTTDTVVPATPVTPPVTSAPTTTDTVVPATPVTPPVTSAPTTTDTVVSAAPVTPPVTSTPTTTDTEIPTTPVTQTPSLAMLSEKSNALASLRQAQGWLLTQNLQGIHQRLGELKTDKASNVWVKNTNSRTDVKAQNVAADSRSSGFEMDSHSLQIGADRAVSDNFRVGGFVGTSRADVDFNGEYGKGKLRSQAVGFYATFANADGWYVDNVGKYERLTAQTAGEKRKYNAFSLSTEIGKQLTFANDWTLTPQAQLAYHTISGKADESRLSLFTARAGVRVAKGFSFANGWNLQPYAEFNAIAEKANNANVRVNQYRFDVPENRGRFQTAIGFIAGNSSHRLGLEVSTTHGKQIKQPLALQVNYRYQW